MKSVVSTVLLTVTLITLVACSPRVQSVGELQPVAVDPSSVVGQISLPAQVAVTYSDGSSGLADVVWDTSSLPKTLTTDIEVTGKVKGTDLPAHLELMVRQPEPEINRWIDQNLPALAPEEVNIDSAVSSIIDIYFQLRENSVVSSTSAPESTPSPRDLLKSQLSGTVDQQLLVDEDARQRGHARAAKNAEIFVFDSRTTIGFYKIIAEQDTIRLQVRETTMCDYRGVNNPNATLYDTFGFALWHDILFSRVDGSWVLVKDVYDEPDNRKLPA